MGSFFLVIWIRSSHHHHQVGEGKGRHEERGRERTGRSMMEEGCNNCFSGVVVDQPWVPLGPSLPLPSCLPFPSLPAFPSLPLPSCLLPLVPATLVSLHCKSHKDSRTTSRTLLGSTSASPSSILPRSCVSPASPCAGLACLTLILGASFACHVELLTFYFYHYYFH